MAVADFSHFHLFTFSLLLGWLLDLLIGDPSWLPHPVVGFGKVIAFGERHLNKGSHRKLKGALLAVSLVAGVFVLTWLVLRRLLTFHVSLFTLFNAFIVFYCLAGTTLIREVREVFLALDRSLDEGRKQVARIVGRDTSELSAQEVRTAALETLAENLSDGVIAPLLWFMLLGAPGMLAYKMVNTLDSMIGYRTDRYRDFGCWAARIDDIANYIPARLTALLMIVSPLSRPLPRGGEASAAKYRSLFQLFSFVHKYGRKHASPNSGYPEAALAGILDCRFGGPHYYFGELFDKPYIGENNRSLTTADMRTAIRVNRTAEVLMVVVTSLVLLLVSLLTYFVFA
jgi:adenosylcobinamide-phosphate synthase